MTKFLTFQDSETGVTGWLAYDDMPGALAAGGCRAQDGLTPAELAVLASRMTLKQRVLGLNVGGAKCGIDCGPGEAERTGVLGRFVGFLRDELMTRFSMGSDMGTEWRRLQELAAAAGVPSTKYAVKAAQGLTDEEFFGRVDVLREQVGPLTVSQRRAGHALAHAAIGAARAAGYSGRFDCALQGFGTLGRAAACSLAEEGVRITAVADEHACIADPRGLDAGAMLASRHGTPVPESLPGARPLPSQAVLAAPADVLVLAACADALPPAQAASCSFPVVAVGANCGLSPSAEQALQRRGVFVVPDFIGGIGGSASMEALFGPARRPSGSQMLDSIAQIMRQLIDDMAVVARRDASTPADAAVALAASATAGPGLRPYGHCRYLPAPAL